MTDAVVTLLDALTLISILMLVALGLAVIYGRFRTIGPLTKELRDWHQNPCKQYKATYLRKPFESYPGGREIGRASCRERV